MAAPESDDRNADNDDLVGIDLSSLDLDGIDIDDRPSEAWRWLGLLLLLGLGGLVLWLPNTEWFRLMGHDSGPFFVLTAAGIVIGILLGRWLWLWGLAAAERYAARAQARVDEPAKPPSALRRWFIFALILGGAAAILYVPASAYYQQGDSYQTTWFLAAGGAVVVGIVLGRWLLMQAAAARARQKERPPLVLPPWFKWVTLAVLGVVFLVVLIGKLTSGGETPGAFGFSLGATGFIVGLGGAIWLARRFDEFEKRHEQRVQSRNEAAPQRPPTPN